MHKKWSLGKKLNKLEFLKRHLPLHVVSVQEFETIYGLPNTSKNRHKFKIPLNLVEIDLVEIFGLSKGRKRRVGYAFSKCMDEEVYLRIVEIFSLVYLRDLPKSKVIAKQFVKGIVIEKHKKKLVS